MHNTVEFIGGKDGPKGFQPPELHLAGSEAPQGAFFIGDAKKEPDQERLRRTAEIPFSADTICIELVEELGLVDPPAIIDEFRRQADALAHKPDMDVSDETMLFHLASHIDRRTDLQRSVAQASRLYEKVYWEDFSRRTGQRNNEIESDLFVNPLLEVGGTPTSLIHITKLRRDSSNGREAAKNFMDAERIVRMLVINERTGGAFFEDLEARMSNDEPTMTNLDEPTTNY